MAKEMTAEQLLNESIHVPWHMKFRAHIGFVIFATSMFIGMARDQPLFLIPMIVGIVVMFISNGDNEYIPIADKYQRAVIEVLSPKLRHDLAHIVKMRPKYGDGSKIYGIHVYDLLNKLKRERCESLQQVLIAELERDKPYRCGGGKHVV